MSSDKRSFRSRMGTALRRTSSVYTLSAAGRRSSTPSLSPPSPLLAGNVINHNSNNGAVGGSDLNPAPIVVSPAISRAVRADKRGPFSGADAAIMADAFRKAGRPGLVSAFRNALRKLDFAGQPVDGDSPESPKANEELSNRELAEEGQDIRSVNSSRVVRVETSNDKDDEDVAVKEDPTTDERQLEEELYKLRKRDGPKNPEANAEVSNREVAQEGQDIRSVSSSRGVGVETLSDGSIEDTTIMGDLITNKRQSSSSLPRAEETVPVVASDCQVPFREAERWYEADSYRSHPSNDAMAFAANTMHNTPNTPSTSVITRVFGTFVGAVAQIFCGCYRLPETNPTEFTSANVFGTGRQRGADTPSNQFGTNGVKSERREEEETTGYM